MVRVREGQCVCFSLDAVGVVVGWEFCGPSVVVEAVQGAFDSHLASRSNRIIFIYIAALIRSTSCIEFITIITHYSRTCQQPSLPSALAPLH